MPAASDPAVVPGPVGGRSDRIAIVVQQDEVLTGEAVALDVQPLGFFLRALGTLIDITVAVAIFIALTLTANWLVGQTSSGGDFFGILSIVVAVLVAVVLPTAVETISHGRSLGRLAVGGRIVRVDGGASGFRQAFIRAFVGVLEIWMTAGAVAALAGAFTPRSQRLGDLLAGTYCERTRTPPLTGSALAVPPALVDWARIADVARLPDRLARRCAQFVQNADRMAPSARARLSTALATEVASHVSPVLPVDPETFVRGVVAVRRDRELLAILLEDRRVASLGVGVSGEPRDFPVR